MPPHYTEKGLVVEKEPPKTRQQAEEEGLPAVEDQEQGVVRIEALFKVLGRGRWLYALYGSIFIIAYASSLSSNVVYNFLPFATSAFGRHSFLGTIDTINAISAAVCQPLIAKVADITSRPTAYLLVLSCYTLGFVLLASAPTVSAVAAGQIFFTIGSVGLDLVTSILVGDLTPLQWRAFGNGVVAAPYIVNAYISGFIVTNLTESGWRWGFGTFAILMPSVVVPALLILFHADRLAKKQGLITLSASSYVARTGQSQKSWLVLLKEVLIHIDFFGLLLIGFAWALLLLPFTLSAGAKGGYNNPSLIAMFVVGGILIIFFFCYECLWAPFPILPRRVLNRTFIISCVIDFLYYFSYYLGSTYLSSWIYLVKKNWTLYEWTAFTNTLGVCLCLGGLIVGLLHRYTHRYKYLQIFGLCLFTLGSGLNYYATYNSSNAVLAVGAIVLGFGGACSVQGTQVASQASVPHADLAIVISNLALWTRLGGAIGSAISANYWTSHMPANLSRYLTGILSEEEILGIYGDLTLARDQTDAARAGTFAAYNDTIRPLFAGAIGVAAAALIAGFFASNYRLDKKMNAVTDKIHPVYGNQQEVSRTPGSDKQSI